MRTRHASHGDAVVPGTILIAPPDHHMLVADGAIRLTRGAKENLARPAIDPLFRSAAACFGARVVGVVLSGRLDDGTAGLQAIKACGGLAIVQDPADALEPSMPQSALRQVEVDWTTRGDELAAALQHAIRQPIVSEPALPAALRLENDLIMDIGNDMSGLDAIGRPAKLSCPAPAVACCGASTTAPRHAFAAIPVIRSRWLRLTTPRKPAPTMRCGVR